MGGEETVERRIVTVLFADLVGFTTLSEQYDPEDVAQIQDRYFAIVRETIGRYGGRLEKFIGDAAMAVFGVPRSRDDDAERAVRAGLALVHGVQQIGTELGLDDDVLQLRVGINTGEAVVAAAGADEGRVTGDTVNTAARLQAAAPPGGVLIGETTALAVADVADLESVPPLELKGKARATAARLITGMRVQASRDQAMGALRAPTLGREQELATLDQAYRRAAAGGVERWLIVAPPGVGKSRLLRELSARLETVPTASVWRTRARPDSVSPFEAIATLLQEALGGAGRADAEQLLGGSLAAAGVQEARARVVTEACLAAVWPQDAAAEGRPREERDALFGAWLDALDALAGDQTQVWLFEDVHWAGGDALAFLDAAAERPRRLILATARPSVLDAHAEWSRSDPDAGRHVMQLSTLAATDARALIGALVGDALPHELVERIAQRSDGNCLFIEELIRTWVSVGTLVDDGSGGWRLAVPADEIPLPASVQSIYAAQLDDLPPDARRVARRASVAGRRFPVAALAPLDAADGGLGPLRRRELVTGPVAEPLLGDSFAYRHALLRDAGYASLARAERARLHIRLARWLEQAAGEHGAEIAEQIAGHYAAALESAPSLARELDDGVGREDARRLAAEWYERAGQGTLSVAAHDAARQLFRRSIDLTPQENTLEQARRWERLGDATAFAADMDEGAAAYQRSIVLYRQAMSAGAEGFDSGSEALERTAAGLEQGGAALHKQMAALGDALGIPGLGDGLAGLGSGAAEMRQGAEELRAGKHEFEKQMAAAGLARATAALGDVWYQQLRFAEARDMAAQTLEELGDSDPASTARLLIARAEGSLGASGPSPAAEADFQRALELARSAADEDLELEALESLTVLRNESGKGSARDWDEIGELAERRGRWESAITARINSAISLLDDDVPQAYERAAEGRELALARGRIEDAGWADYVEAEAAFIEGDWDRAVAAGRKALDVAEANAYRRLAVRTVHVLVPIGAARGERQMLERAAAFYGALETDDFEFPDSPYSRVMRAAQDLELAAAGLREPFVPDVEPRIVSFADEPGGGSWSAALDRVFRAWLDAGDLDGAARALDAMEAALPGFARLSALGRGTYELMRGRLAAARDARDTAAEAGRAALASFRTSAAPWWMAKAIRLLQRAGAAEDELVAEALEIERRLGAAQPTA